MSEEIVAEKLPKILCVDDEPNILSSLRRLFRSKGYQVLTAVGGAEGLAVLETETVDLVISDMRMPVMDGAVFLEHVRSRWPDTIRLLLTGYADVQSIIDAINRGEIYRYITKPWDDNDIVLVVREALERKALEREKKRLEELAARQNEELKALNASLEAKVDERTAALRTVNDSMLRANEKLKNSFLTSIKVFSNVIEMRCGNLDGHSRRVADLARKIAKNMDLDVRMIQDVFVAGLLADIGRIGFSDVLLNTPISELAGESLGMFHKHTQRAEQLLMPLEDLQATAKIIRYQHERVDGRGLPEGLKGDAIPLGARILAVASDYDYLQIGGMTVKRVFPEDAQALIIRGAGSRYDEKVIAAFKKVFNGGIDDTAFTEIPVRDLRNGMVIFADVISKDGILLMPAGKIIDDEAIDSLLLYSTSTSEKLVVRIRALRRK